MKLSVGFTLIELLIAIAIIGVLASVILPRIQNARNQGDEARIFAELEAFHKNGMNEEIKVGNFNVVCGQNGETMASALTTVWNSLNTNSATVVCNSTVTSFAASAELEPGRHWCVDNSGTKKEITAGLGSGVTACP